MSRHRLIRHKRHRDRLATEIKQGLSLTPVHLNEAKFLLRTCRRKKDLHDSQDSTPKLWHFATSPHTAQNFVAGVAILTNKISKHSYRIVKPLYTDAVKTLDYKHHSGDAV